MPVVRMIDKVRILSTPILAQNKDCRVKVRRSPQLAWCVTTVVSYTLIRSRYPAATLLQNILRHLTIRRVGYQVLTFSLLNSIVHLLSLCYLGCLWKALHIVQIQETMKTNEGRLCIFSRRNEQREGEWWKTKKWKEKGVIDLCQAH